MAQDRANDSRRAPDILKGRVTNVADEYASQMADIKNRVSSAQTEAKESTSMKKERAKQERSLTHGDVKGYDY